MTPLLLSLLMAIATADSPAVYTSPSSTYLGSDGASLDASAFHEAVAPYHPAMLSCTDGQETTRATINVSVGAKGKTKSIVDTEQAHVVSCLREALKSLRVPEYPKGSSVRFEALIGSVEGNPVKLGSLEKTAKDNTVDAFRSCGHGTTKNENTQATNDYWKTANTV